MTPLLKVRELHVAYTARSGERSHALSGVNFALEYGETLGVLGESGSGKSTLAAALLRLLPVNGEIAKGSICFEGRDLLHAESCEIREIRGGRIALIFQEPSLALHPGIPVDQQVRDVITAHMVLSRREVQERARRVLAAVFPKETERIARAYPHQLSGGQRSRVLIAQAISCGPSLIVADEPTASLDPETQMEILAVFRSLREEFSLSLIWITHNPALLAGFADRVLVLYAGRVVEIGPAVRVLNTPQHPYTKALLSSLPPRLPEGLSSRKTRLPAISGEVAGVALAARQCAFEPRCAERMDICAKREPGTVALDDRHEVSCFKYED